MGSQERLSSEARKQAIIESVLPVFAELGFHAVTTRQLAQAAGISEALLYRHFRSKEDLFVAIQSHCLTATTVATAERLVHLAPSTQTLVKAISFMVFSIIAGPETQIHGQSIKRLMLGSMLEDGEFARGFLRSNMLRWMDKMVESLRAADAAGDLDGPLSEPELRIWMAHHTAAMVTFFRLPEEPIVRYGLEVGRLTDEVTRQALRGLGLSTEAIERHYTSEMAMNWSTLPEMAEKEA